MNVEQLKEQLNEVKKGISNNALSSNDIAFIIKYYPVITRKTFVNRGCNDCVKDAGIEMYLTINKKDFTMEGKYILRNGATIPYKGRIMSRANMTDEIAKGIINDFPDWEPYFTIVESPKEETEKVDPKVKEAKTSAKKVTKKATDPIVESPKEEK